MIEKQKVRLTLEHLVLLRFRLQVSMTLRWYSLDGCFDVL